MSEDPGTDVMDEVRAILVSRGHKVDIELLEVDGCRVGVRVERAEGKIAVDRIFVPPFQSRFPVSPEGAAAVVAAVESFLELESRRAKKEKERSDNYGLTTEAARRLETETGSSGLGGVGNISGVRIHGTYSHPDRLVVRLVTDDISEEKARALVAFARENGMVSEPPAGSCGAA